MSASASGRVRAVRMRARRRGLRMLQSGDVFRLYDGAGRVVETGQLTAIEAYLAERFLPRRLAPQSGTKAPTAWAQIIDGYMLTLAAAGQPRTTMELRRIQLVRMARDLGGRPADVTGEKLVEWFGRQTEWTIETRRSYRAGIRGFFRWAYRTKRVPDHLADELPKVGEQRGQRGRRGRGPTAYEAICLTSGMSSASTEIICSVRSVCALHTTHCRPNVTFRIGLSGNNLWKQSKQIF